MSRRKEPVIPSDLLDQLLAGGDAAAALQQGGLLDSLKKALAERALNAEMDHHLGHEEQAGNSRNGYGRKTVAGIWWSAVSERDISQIANCFQMTFSLLAG